MGILNCTPDSFSDGGSHRHDAERVAAAQAMAAAGATWVDIGGESSRPGAEPVAEADELQRVVPVVAAIAAQVSQLAISVDTVKGAVAEAALAAGAHMINDISAGSDPRLLDAVASHGAGLCLMHMRGTPATMQDAPCYDNVVDEVLAALDAARARAARHGIADEQIVVDPGIGFGKRVEDNVALLAALPRIATHTGRPLLLGVSRKSLLPALSGRDLPPAERDGQSHLLHAQLAWHCALLRVHDVVGAGEAVRLALPIGGWS
ncbi:MAG: dihydropteroate synthase [Planctomycetota bacterium]|jgi:dihydropteroate synthase